MQSKLRTYNCGALSAAADGLRARSLVKLAAKPFGELVATLVLRG